MAHPQVRNERGESTYEERLSVRDTCSFMVSVMSSPPAWLSSGELLATHYEASQSPTDLAVSSARLIQQRQQ